MKLIRFGEIGHEKPGIQLDDKRIDVSAFGEDYHESFFASNGIERLRAWLKDNEAHCPLVENHLRWGSPIGRPSKIICVGLNYAKHAQESGMAKPKEPVLFFKATSAIVGPNDDLIIPRGAEKTDWEVELAFVMKKEAAYVEKDQALDYVAGYVLHNDYSERAFQLEREGQWVKGKSNDTFAPLGPYLVTSDEVGNPHQLDLWLKLNGEMMQSSNTEDLIFDIPTLVSYISQFMTLLPGDVISTGTPFGVGLGLNPPKYLKPGDVVELGIEKLGSSKQHVKAYTA